MKVTDTPLGLHIVPDDAATPVPGIVLIHDVWGPSDHSRQLAEKLAGFGYAVLAVDLYRRESAAEISNPGEWIRNLSDPEILHDIGDAVRFLASDPASVGRKVGVMGVCMGGMYALMAGCGDPAVSAIAPFYGLLSHDHGLLHVDGGLDPARKPESPLEAAKALSCPMFAAFGADDDFIPQTDVDALATIVGRTDQPTEIVVYPGAGHAFLNETRPDAYRPEAAAEAWKRLREFFDRELAGV